MPSTYLVVTPIYRASESTDLVLYAHNCEMALRVNLRTAEKGDHVLTSHSALSQAAEVDMQAVSATTVLFGMAKSATQVVFYVDKGWTNEMVQLSVMCERHSINWKVAALDESTPLERPDIGSGLALLRFWRLLVYSFFIGLFAMSVPGHIVMSLTGGMLREGVDANALALVATIALGCHAFALCAARGCGC